MMSLTDIAFLAIALAMDCFTVSIVSGVLSKFFPLRMAFFFGLFQALMPLIGWLGISHFSHYLQAVDHWIAFCLLTFIGAKMIKEAFEPEEVQHFNPHKLSTQLVLAVATSIDALAVGISFACTGYERLSQLTVPLVIIGVVSLLFSLFGYLLGRRFGHSIASRLKPELFGGIILILIGVKILINHLAEGGSILG